jgi:hypothetical protein
MESAHQNWPGTLTAHSHSLLEAGHLLLPPSHARIFLISLIPYSKFYPTLLSADDLPPPLTHDASLTYQIPSSLPSPIQKLLSTRFNSFPLSLPPFLPHTDRPPYGSTFITLRFSSSLLSAPARASLHPPPCRYVTQVLDLA